MAMNIWTAVKRLNQRTDEWSSRAIERMIANLDSRDKRPARKHIGLRDLVANGVDPEKRAP